MTNENEEAIEIFKSELDWAEQNRYPYISENKVKADKLAIKALEQQPCEDCISREEVQDLISRWLSDYLLDETREALETINYKVGDMPSVTPQRPKGKWIEIEIDAGEFIYKCTKCGMRVINPYKYCPICGAEMSGGSEDEISN